MLNRPRRSLLAVLLSPLTLILGSLALVGCGDKLSDDAYGFIDLAPYYYDGSSPTNPSAGLTRVIAVQKGWLNGVRAEYYDFGLVGFVKKRTNTALPDYGSIPAMYFFFDTAGNPLFSAPVYETRTGYWYMRGGLNTLNPNPDSDADKTVPYSVRKRSPLMDGARGSADYQRPIIDKLQSDTVYSGLWEIWEVTAPDDYVPDAIKSLGTLNKAIASGGQWAMRRTQKVINCPVVDDRQTITPTATWYGIPHPRIELWYKTKLGSCFLADGWLALGDFKGNLIHANNDPARLQMFDVIDYQIAGAVTLVAPVQKLYVPKVTIANPDPTKDSTDVRYANDYTTDAGPRYRPSDPHGYSPLRWLWDLKVSQDPPYVPGSYKNVSQMDPVNLSARSGPFVKNYPTIGTVKPCPHGDSDCTPDMVPSAPGITLQCNQWPNAGLATTDPPPGTTAAQLTLDQEGGPRCDVPQKTFGSFCAPGVAQCLLNLKGTPDEKPMVDIGKGPTATSTSLLGYTCQPMGTGYCYFRCDTDASAGTSTMTPVSITYPGPPGSGTMKTDTTGMALGTDARCGNIPGYKCLNPAPKTPTVPGRMRVCLRACDTGKPDSYNAIYCGGPNPQMPTPSPLSPSLSINGKTGQFIQKGMVCSNNGIDSASGCQWDPAFEPRDPSISFVP